jgi:hypothetical protein
MNREPLKRTIWRRVNADGTMNRRTMTALRPHEQEAVRRAVTRLHSELGTWHAVSLALGVPMKTMARVMTGERPVQDRLATVVARAFGVGLDDVLSRRLPAPGRCPFCGRADSGESKG